MSSTKSSRLSIKGREALSIYWLTDIHLDRKMAGLSADAPAGAIRHRVLYIHTGLTRLQNFIERVNRDLPDLAICTGDLVDSYREYVNRHHLKISGVDERGEVSDLLQAGEMDNDEATLNFKAFKREWDAINSRVKKALTIGNHDAMSLPQADIARILGYNKNRATAGSHFNYAFSIDNGEISVRVLMVDTTVGADPSEWCFTGRLLQAAQDWISHELAHCSENRVFLCLHHGPHAYDEPDPINGNAQLTQFDAGEAAALRDLVNDAVADRPSLSVHCLFGHAHTGKRIRCFSNLGPNLPGYLSPCAIDFESGLFAILKIFPGGSLQVKTVRL